MQLVARRVQKISSAGQQDSRRRESRLWVSFERTDKGVDPARANLGVRVEKEQMLTSSLLRGQIAAVSESEIRMVPDQMDLWKPCADEVGAAVRRTVVDDENLGVGSAVREQRTETRVDVRSTVVVDYDDRNGLRDAPRSRADGRDRCSGLRRSRPT